MTHVAKKTKRKRNSQASKNGHDEKCYRVCFITVSARVIKFEEQGRNLLEHCQKFAKPFPKEIWRVVAEGGRKGLRSFSVKGKARSV